MVKKRDRVFEKVLLKHGDFATIYDYARLAFVIPDPALVPKLVKLLLQVDEFKVVRSKNRLDPAVSAYDSGGYRDCQCLVRVPSGWVVELQLIPGEIYDLRKQCGHAAYKEQRFVLEARKRSEAVDFQTDHHTDNTNLVAKIMHEQAAHARVAKWRRASNVMIAATRLLQPPQRADSSVGGSGARRPTATRVQPANTPTLNLHEEAYASAATGAAPLEQGGAGLTQYTNHTNL